jgi:hypothetical protein
MEHRKNLWVVIVNNQSEPLIGKILSFKINIKYTKELIKAISFILSL